MRVEQVVAEIMDLAAAEVRAVVAVEEVAVQPIPMVHTVAPTVSTVTPPTPSPASTIVIPTTSSGTSGSDITNCSTVRPAGQGSKNGKPKKQHTCSKAKVAEKVKEIEGKDKIIRAQRVAIKSYQEQLVSALQNTIRLQEYIVKFNEKEVKRLRREVRRLQARPRNIPTSGLNRWSLWGCD